MNFSDAFKRVMKSRNMTQQALAHKTDTKQGSIASMLYKGNPSLKVASRYLKACGYNIVLVPSESNLPDDWFVVDEFEGSRSKSE